jgi:hypothetical protein
MTGERRSGAGEDLFDAHEEHYCRGGSDECARCDMTAATTPQPECPNERDGDHRSHGSQIRDDEEHEIQWSALMTVHPTLNRFVERARFMREHVLAELGAREKRYDPQDDGERPIPKELFRPQAPPPWNTIKNEPSGPT